MLAVIERLHMAFKLLSKDIPHFHQHWAVLISVRCQVDINSG